MRIRLTLTAAVTAGIIATMGAGVAAPAAPASCAVPTFGPGASYHPAIDPAAFSPNVINPWYPLIPGTVFVYAGVKDGKAALDIYAPSARTKRIDGVTTRVVEDRLFLNNHLAERTTDYYAQDKCGNVWYFGEDTVEVSPSGRVTTPAGSFHAGVRGAQPGVYMQANPQIGREFRQEWLRGQAEDQFRASSYSARTKVPYGHFSHLLKTTETSALEPGIIGIKLYRKGVGELLESDITGPQETLKLVEVIRP